MNITKILVPVDFSSCSRAALEAAVDLAGKYGATVEALHVHEPPYAVGHVTVQVPGMGEVAMIDFMHGQARSSSTRCWPTAMPRVTVTRTLLAGLPEKLIVKRPGGRPRPAGDGHRPARLQPLPHGQRHGASCGWPRRRCWWCATTGEDRRRRSPPSRPRRARPPPDRPHRETRHLRRSRKWRSVRRP
ncbi:MAG: universal stress protein [bacterium]